MMIDLSKINVLLPIHASDFEKRVTEMFVEEVLLRADVKLPVTTASVLPVNGSYILFSTFHTLDRQYPGWSINLSGLPHPGDEGFCVYLSHNAGTQIIIAGADERGCLYGMARVLRKLTLKNGRVELPDDFSCISVTPSFPLRGHQLAYRDKNNTLPAWDVEDFDRYIRDLALFGSNAIELLPPRTDDNLFSQHFKRDPFEMMIKLAHIIHSYGMDVWLWYPNVGDDYSDPVKYQEELDEREKIFSAIPYLNGVLVPAGDPGELNPVDFFKVTGDSMKILHKYHPDARVWVAPVCFEPEEDKWHQEFYGELDKQPDWLYGVSLAPWIPETLQELYDRIPQLYKGRIRNYPDITHSSSSMFEMPDWDYPLAATLGREGYNARPNAMKQIHNLYEPYTIGSITYSEGLNDDVNKMIWGDQDFCFGMDVRETLEDYVRLFIDPDIVKELSGLLLALEDNWKGEITNNANIDQVYERFIELEKKVCQSTRDNYRFKMALLRAVSDYQTKVRFIYDTEMERLAIDELGRAAEVGADCAVYKAKRILLNTFEEPIREDLRHKMQKLADELFETPNCHIQLTTARHGGQSWRRGAYLDSLDFPLNDYQWYTQHFKRILKLENEQEKLSYINWLLKRNDPGEGGFYACLGDLDSFRQHVIRDYTWEQDPSFLRTPVVCIWPGVIGRHFHRMRGWYDEYPMAVSWLKCARVLYGTPLKVRFEGLAPGACYRVRVTYPLFSVPNEFERLYFNMYAGDSLIHEYIDRDKENKNNPIFEFDLPQESYQDGNLLLTWRAHKVLLPLNVSEILIYKLP